MLHCNVVSLVEPIPRMIHYNDVIMGAIASQITSLTIVYSTVYSDADRRKHQSSASLAFVRGIHRGPVNSPHKWPVTRKMFPIDDVIMIPAECLVSEVIENCSSETINYSMKLFAHMLCLYAKKWYKPSCVIFPMTVTRVVAMNLLYCICTVVWACGSETEF